MAIGAVVESSEQAKIGSLGIFQPPDIHIESPIFTGSLGMLFAFVKDKKIDLLDLPLAPVCEAYFQYVLQELDADLESTGVAMAALSYLIERKAWLLIPSPQTEEPEDEDILTQIEPYVHEFNQAIKDLYDLQEEREKVFFRSKETAKKVYELPFNTESVSPDDLARAFESLMSRAIPDPVETLNKTRRTLSEVMNQVSATLPEDFKPLEEIVTGDYYRSEVVWWFLALLELIRLGQARVKIVSEEILFARGQAD